MDEQRRDLGGEGDHSILVKGLDMALLEQNKARVGLSTEDDDSLEQAFLETSISAESSKTQKKKTREDFIRELKEKRELGQVDLVNNVASTAEDDARRLEEAKKAGKFKPINAPAEDKAKRKRDKDKDVEKKKKKRKGEGVSAKVETKETLSKTQANEKLPPPPSKVAPQRTHEPPAESEMDMIGDDFDIFAGAGEYQGIDLDDDDGDDGTGSIPQVDHLPKDKEDHPAVGQWVAVGERETFQPSHSHDKVVLQPSAAAKTSQKEGDGDEEQPARLMSLENSALPSIKDFLALDEAAESSERRRKRKEKRKAGKGNESGQKGKLTTDAKVERDYKKYVQGSSLMNTSSQ